MSNNLNKVTNVSRAFKNVDRISYVYDKLSKDKSEEGKKAFKSYKKTIIVTVITMLSIMCVFGYGIFYGDIYYNNNIPENTEPIQCYSDSERNFHTSHDSLKGMTLAEVGMDREDYDGKTFFVFVDKDTDKFVSSMTREEYKKIATRAENITMYSYLGLFVGLILDLIVIYFTVARVSRVYMKNHNI